MVHVKDVLVPESFDNLRESNVLMHELMIAILNSAKQDCNENA